jgi:hypothetical protein
MDGSSSRLGGGWGLFSTWECSWALNGFFLKDAMRTAAGIAYRVGWMYLDRRSRSILRHNALFHS